MTSCIMSVILKLAGNTKIFRKVTNATDRLQLQQDLNRLCDWVDKWQMEFNPFKPSGAKWLHYKVFKAILV